MKNSFWKNWKKFFGAFMVVTLLTACGKDAAKSNGGDGAIAYSPLATSNSAFNSFQQAVYEMKFVKPMYTNWIQSSHERFYMTVEEKSTFFNLLKYPDVDIHVEGSFSRSGTVNPNDGSYTSLRFDDDSTVTTSEALRNKLMSYLTSVNQSYRIDCFMYSCEFITNNLDRVRIDLSVPMIANPVYIFNINTQKGQQLRTYGF